jgi:hypothetical protein
MAFVVLAIGVGQKRVGVGAQEDSLVVDHGALCGGRRIVRRPGASAFGGNRRVDRRVDPVLRQRLHERVERLRVVSRRRRLSKIGLPLMPDDFRHLVVRRQGPKRRKQHFVEVAAPLPTGDRSRSDARRNNDDVPVAPVRYQPVGQQRQEFPAVTHGPQQRRGGEVAFAIKVIRPRRNGARRPFRGVVGGIDWPMARITAVLAVGRGQATATFPGRR